MKTTAIRLRLFDTGFCTVREGLVIRGGGKAPRRFPAPFALLEHPDRGPWLFDTGYSSRFFQETRRLPYSIYAGLTPVSHQDDMSAVNKLRRVGINPEDIENIIVSHFHADHVCGLKDFPKARYWCLEQAYKDVEGKKGLAALARGHIPGLLPADFRERMEPVDRAPAVRLGEGYSPFETGYDIFGDGSLLIVPLEGHARGQAGALVQTEDGPVFLVADACWLSRSYQENLPPGSLAYLFFSSRKAYLENLARLHELHRLNPGLRILPSHCSKALASCHQPE